MFTVIWDALAFDQMQAIILWNPDRRAELAAALHVIDHELTHHANTWGESRDPPFRLAFTDDVAVLYTVDEENRVAEIVEVRLRGGSPE